MSMVNTNWNGNATGTYVLAIFRDERIARSQAGNAI